MTRDRDILREEWRVKAVEHVKLLDKAARLKEGKDIFLGELVNTLMEQNATLSNAAAERMAKTSDAYKGYLHRMHDARTEANLAEIVVGDADKKYWESVRHEATSRAEMKMGR